MARVVTIFENSYGKEHPNVATALNNLAQLLQATNRLSEAEPLMRRALAIDEKLFGEENGIVATDLNNLSLLIKELGKFDEAENLMQKAVEVFATTLGPTHPNTVIAEANLREMVGER
jgi:tetratricopeptide (TPR) repeat protein